MQKPGPHPCNHNEHAKERWADSKNGKPESRRTGDWARIRADCAGQILTWPHMGKPAALTERNPASCQVSKEPWSPVARAEALR